MAHIYHGAAADETRSPAERDLLERFKRLPDDFTIIHSAPWITHDVSQYGPVGEVDFIVAYPGHGVLILEVKGGEISLKREGSRTNWYSTNTGGTVHEIKDPCQQADRSCWALKEWLDKDYRTRKFSYAVFPAVALPDSHVTSDIRPDCPKEIIMDMTRVDALERSLLDIFAYWKQKQPHLKMGGKAAIDALVELLVPTRTLSPQIAEIFRRERREIDALTEQQFRILKQLRAHRRAAIVGGAGTGKTMLAMEKVRQLADAGFRVLFLCFNTNLADWLEDRLDDPSIDVMTFHSLVGRAIHWAKLPSDPRMKEDALYAQAADILMDAAEKLQSAGESGAEKLYDAIVVDEAQDFHDEWWIPLPDMLKDPEDGIFYVFFDDNQRIYTQISNIPFQSEPYFLTENCRNTRGIFSALKPYARPGDETECIGPQGRPVEIIQALDHTAARKTLQQVLHRLVNQEGIDTEDVIILTPASPKRSEWEDDDILGNFVLTWNMETAMERAIRICTIYRFKGLECAVVILSEMDKAHEEIRDELVYVGLSRARNHAIVIGEFPAPSGRCIA